MKLDALFWQRMHGGMTHLLIVFVMASVVFGGSERAKAPVDQDTLAAGGHHLFLMNCAHCHGTDATGDEGPDLHGVKKSDSRIAAMIKNGVKGEMPKFSTKLSEEDVQSLIAFIRSL